MKKTILSLTLIFCISSYGQNISTIAGNGTNTNTGDGGAASAATINPVYLTFDPSGNLYIACTQSYKIRKINTSGIITTVAGTGTFGYSGDGGSATSANMTEPCGIASDASGNIYFGDRLNMRVRKISTSGIITTVAGTGVAGYSGDGGSSTSAKLYDPSGIAVDASGNLYIADSQNNRIRKVNTSGIISTVAGTGTGGYSGDGGSATSAQIYVSNLTLDGSGNIYFTDGVTYRIRKVNTSGIISTVAGNGTWAYTGDGGQATSASISIPYAIAVDQWGTLYISDWRNNAIRTVNTNGIIKTIAGTGTSGFSGDGGPPSSAQLNWPEGIAINSSNNLYISDAVNYRIRKFAVRCPVDAGPNQTNYQDICGHWTPGVTIGTPSSGFTYYWHTGTNLSSTSVAQPTSTYSTTLSSATITYTLVVSGSGCTTDSSTVSVTAVKNTCPGCCRLAAVATGSEEKATIYPVPATNIITINSIENLNRILIYNINGQCVYENTRSEVTEVRLDLSKFNRGIYFAIIEHGEVVEKKKIILE